MTVLTSSSHRAGQGVSQDHFGSLIHHMVLEITLGSHFRLRSHFSENSVHTGWKGCRLLCLDSQLPYRPYRQIVPQTDTTAEAEGNASRTHEQRFLPLIGLLGTHLPQRGQWPGVDLCVRSLSSGVERQAPGPRNKTRKHVPNISPIEIWQRHNYLWV